MTGFNLEKFKEIITSEIDELYDQYEKERTEKNNEGKYNKKTKEFKVSEIPKEKLKKTLKYYHDHVFKTIQGNYFVQLTEDKNKVSPMSAKTFNEVFGQTIKEFHPNLLKQDTIRYEVDIYDDNFTVDRKNKRINLASSFNFSLNDSPLLQEEEEQLNYLLDEFLFKVICDSNQNVYDFLLDMIGCYAHRKQSNVILILVGIGGTGKSKFIELLQSLFGSSCKMMTGQVLSGQDMFNSSMIGTSIGYIEETNGKGESNYTDIQRTLKRLSTSKFITCRKMQTDSFDVLNIINFVVITNFIKDIKHDRRNFPLEPSTHRINDKVFYKKISSIIDNKRLMQGLFNMVYKRSFDVWSRTLPQTEVLNDFTEKNSMKLIHEFFIDEFIYQNREDKYPINTLFDMYNKYLLERKKDINISESIFRHEVRQFLTKDSYHPKNVTHYTTTKDSIKDNLSKRKITNEMIEARKPHEEDFEEVFCINDYDPVERLQADNLKLTNRIHEQNKIIEEQKLLIENLKKMLDKTPSEENAPKKKKKVSQVVNKEWDKLKSII